MTIKEAKEDLITLRHHFEKQTGEGVFPEVLQYCYYLLSAIEKNDKKLMEELMKEERKH